MTQVLSQAAGARPPRVVRGRHTARRTLGAALILGLAWCDAARAAPLRPFAMLHGATVKLSDLFTGLAADQDRDLGPAPEPGQRIVVDAPQLAAIARDYSVAWRPVTGAERVVLERSGAALPPELVTAALREALAAGGAPRDAELSLPGLGAIMLPENAAPHLAVTEAHYDAPSQRFSARLSILAEGMQPLTAHLAGSLVPLTDAPVLTRQLRAGTIVAQSDLAHAHIRAALLHGRAAAEVASVIGMALRHDMAAGEPLTDGDVRRPVLVTRNEVVHMALDAGSISLSGQGIAMEEGGAGDHIRVQNPASRAILSAEITGPGAVRVLPSLTLAALTVAAQ